MGLIDRRTFNKKFVHNHLRRDSVGSIGSKLNKLVNKRRTNEQTNKQLVKVFLVGGELIVIDRSKYLL